MQMSSVVENRPLLNGEPLSGELAAPLSNPQSADFSKLAVALMIVHTLVWSGGFVFWLIVTVGYFGFFMVPAAWAVLSSMFATPLAVNLFMIVVASKRHGRTREREFVLFRSRTACKICAVVAFFGILAGIVGFGGASMGQEFFAAAMALLHVSVCFSLCLFSLRSVILNRSVKPARFYRQPERTKRSQWKQLLVVYALSAVVLGIVAVLVIINGLAAYRVAERGYVFRYGRPRVADFVDLAADRQFFLQCSGSGPGSESDMVILLDADIASSSYGWAWLTGSLSMLWRTCVFDRPGYGWSTGGMPPRTVGRETDDLIEALTAAGVGSSRFIYISHGLSGWNALLFKRALGEQVVSMIFIDPFDPRKLVNTNLIERERLRFISQFGRVGMLINAFGVMQPFYHLITYFQPSFNLPQVILPLFIDSVSREAFWTTMVAEYDVISDSANDTLSAFPFSGFGLGDMPIGVWARFDSESRDYFSKLSTSTSVFNLTDDTHFFIFDKQYAEQIVKETSKIVRSAVR